MTKFSISSMLREDQRKLLRTLADPRGLVKELMTEGTGTIAIMTGQILLTVALSAVLARVLGPASYGVYSYVFTLVSVLIIPAQFGLPKLIVRETAYGQAIGSPGLVRGIWSWSLVVQFITTTIVVIAALIVLLLLHARLSTEVFFTCLLGIALLPLMTFSRSVGGALSGLRNVAAGQFPNTVLRPGILLLLSLVLVWGFGTRLTASSVMGLHVIAATISLLAACLILFRRRPHNLSVSTEKIYHSSAWFAAVIPFVWITGTQQIYQYTDILMIGIFGTKEQVGLYRVAAQAGVLAGIGLMALKMLAQPYIARFYGQSDRRRLHRLLKATSRSAFLLSLLVFIVMIIFGRKLIALVFGHAYLDCYAPLIILTIGQLVNTFFGVVDILLEMTGHQKESSRALFLGAGCNILLNLLLIPFFGLIGAATATAVTILARNLLLWRLAYARLRLDATVIGARSAV